MDDQERRTAVDGVERLVSIMETLRAPGGCEWDRAQTFATIVPYTIEEAHEVADAIARENMEDLCEELGDLLLQVVFHSRMAGEAGHFTLADVTAGICAKMERRHPHIFGPNPTSANAVQVQQSWEDLKAAEKPRDSLLDGVASTLPALSRAMKLAARAARAGFDWPDARGPLAKIHEELAEVEAAGNEAERAEEVGDLLFAAANYARKLGVDPENALRGANRKFEQRFRKIEQVPGFKLMSLEEQEELWQRAKQQGSAELPGENAG